MSPGRSWSPLRLDIVVLVSCAFICMGTHGSVFGYPTASVSLFSHGNKLEDKLVTNDDLAGRNFQQFLSTKPDSSIIGELKPNASELEIMILKNKIASTILSMQEMDKAARSQTLRGDSGELSGSDCFIEVTRIERVPGKCHKVNSGIPICQADNYMAINPDCN